MRFCADISLVIGGQIGGKTSRRTARRAPHPRPCGRGFSREPPGAYSEWQSVELDALPAEDVRHYMTSDPIAVGPEAPIGEVARIGREITVLVACRRNAEAATQGPARTK